MGGIVTIWSNMSMLPGFLVLTVSHVTHVVIDLCLLALTNSSVSSCYLLRQRHRPGFKQEPMVPVGCSGCRCEVRAAAHRPSSISLIRESGPDSSYHSSLHFRLARIPRLAQRSPLALSSHPPMMSLRRPFRFQMSHCLSIQCFFFVSSFPKTFTLKQAQMNFCCHISSIMSLWNPISFRCHIAMHRRPMPPTL